MLQHKKIYLMAKQLYWCVSFDPHHKEERPCSYKIFICWDAVRRRRVTNWISQ